ncbi:N-acetyltransferase B complex non catalytic subunit-domain-containing protein [Hygrophoropsis aurantiaca]|uniref:N-acetyltransferase B complex non catalytic subunit-domain-containing protein n=1 Tax=Hygrophoropsis aurantiaca TaxID=72124 RepID=A0ACB8AL48_9AGAM|nr:N-acetyltransferase B complex non catalytic subunit-domain-containing protein [Hygrophoropsis aurantiaca]
MSEAALERQIRPIYDALDIGSNKTAIVACNKLVKKYPKNTLVKALKALALVRSQKVEESLAICDEVLATKSTDDATLSAMMHVLRGLGRHTDMVTMFEDAYKQQPLNEELGAQTFFANVRTGNWKAAQLIATRMHKQFQEDRYLYWSVMGAILQANDPVTAPTMRTVLYKLAHRLVTSSPTPSYISPDRFHLHLTILRELELWDDANTLLESEVGESICFTNLACDELRRELWQAGKLWKKESDHAQKKINDLGHLNWLEFLSVLDGAFAPLKGDSEASDEAKAECTENITTTRTFFNVIAERYGLKDRSGLLALLELESRAYAHKMSSDQTQLFDLMVKYFNAFGDKACCYEDLRPYTALEGDHLTQWSSFLDSQSPSLDTMGDLQRLINIRKLQRLNLSSAQLTSELETSLSVRYVQEYLQGLPLGSNLPTTDLQPADDLIILAGHSFISLWTMTQDEGHLYNAAAVLEFALAKSQLSFQVRLMLVRIYRLLGAPSLALEHYRQINVKQVQNDTLSHFILTRALTFSLAATGDLTYPSECLESSQIYMNNSQETADFIVRAFTSEKYSQIPDFITFEDRLDNSLQRDVVKVEHVRMRMTHEPLNSDLIDMELIELKFIFNRFHYDNRDFETLPNYQPRCQPSLDRQTLLFGSSSGQGWLWVFLKIYIRAFQQASDLDDTVEDKLLIGDRPKQSNDPENKLPLKERLASRKPEELQELTADEMGLLDWATVLGDWLEPYHDHTRPPAAAVLAEASKQSELKTGLPLRGIDIKPHNGDASNGHSKKDEEAPPVKEAPEQIVRYFESMGARFKELLERKALPSELLHVATITQEAFILFAVETMRFKSASVVKIHKLGTLVQMFKDIRAKAGPILKDMSIELIKFAEREGTAEARKVFVDACKPVMISPAISQDYLLTVAKTVCDARKKVLEGVGKGMAKVCTTHGQS